MCLSQVLLAIYKSMCKVRKKLILFDYLVEQLVKWQEQKTPGLSTTECLQKFNFVRYMKLLYFVCLESVKPEFSSVDGTLFEVYGDFLALDKGPVEINVYSNRSILPRYSFDGQFLSETPQDSNIVEISYPSVKGNKFNNNNIVSMLIQGEGLTEYQALIDSSIAALQSNDSFPFDDTDKLVSLSHQLGMWSKAKLTNDGKLSVDNIFNLKIEKQVFEKITQRN